MEKMKASNVISLSKIKAEQRTLINDFRRKYERKCEYFFKGRDYQLRVRRAEISNIYPTLISVCALNLSFTYRTWDDGWNIQKVLVSSAERVGVSCSGKVVKVCISLANK